MLKLGEVNRIVGKAASAGFGRSRFRRVDSQPTIASIGNEALRVTIVLKKRGYWEDQWRVVFECLGQDTPRP